MSKPILCLDFDGVIHSYTSGWQGADVIPDPPVPGAAEFIINSQCHFTIHIFSSRSHQPGGIMAMRAYIERMIWDVYDEGDGVGEIERNAIAQIVGDIMYPTQKPAAMVTIDDRALTFTGEWPSMNTVLAFKPWNKRL